MPRLPANKWVTVGSCAGLGQRMLHVDVDTDVECQWRKRGFGVFNASSGVFRGKESFLVFNQTLQIRSPIETSYDSHVA